MNRKSFMATATLIGLTGVVTPALSLDSADAVREAFLAAIVAEDAAAVAAVYEEDAINYVLDGTTVEGRDAIAASWQPLFDNYRDIDVSIDVQGEIRTEAAVTSWGLWTMTVTGEADGVREIVKGRFMDVTVKTDAGWLYRADHASVSAMPEAVGME